MIQSELSAIKAAFSSVIEPVNPWYEWTSDLETLPGSRMCPTGLRLWIGWLSDNKWVWLQDCPVVAPYQQELRNFSLSGMFRYVSVPQVPCCIRIGVRTFPLGRFDETPNLGLLKSEISGEVDRLAIQALFPDRVVDG